VTGLLYIELGMHPDAPSRYMQAGNNFMEIPTIPSNLEEIVSRAMQAIARISQLPIEDMVGSFTGLAKSLDELVRDPKIKDAVASINAAAKEAETLLHAVRGEVKPLTRDVNVTAEEARKAMLDVRELADSAKDLVKPGSPLRYQLSTALTELTNAARSLRVLADFLERDPQAVLTGKNPVEP
jgi:paraquat-inducible protein B